VTVVRKRRQYSELPDLELGVELDAQIRAMTELADLHVEELRAKARVRSLVASFLDAQAGLRDQVGRFARQWRRLQSGSLELLANDVGRETARAGGLASVEEDDPVKMIVSLTSWAVLNVIGDEAAIAREAASRGMSRPLASALSAHLAAELSGNSRSGD
jgi:hypothetical protein